jgi:diguanylate cyclase (GGDEF)-like protein/putative nucleotidyltransferase with HDIG domain
MNAYALAPLIAAIAYIPLLITTANSRPWQRRHFLFVLFLIAAMAWSFIVYLFRSNLFPEYGSVLFKIAFIIFSVMVVQFHCFTSSFYPPGAKRWLTFAYVSLIPISILILLGYVTDEVVVTSNYVHGAYKLWILPVSLPMIILSARNLYVFSKILKQTSNPVLHNQILALTLGISVLVVFSVLSIPAWFDAFPIAHYGNLINAFILSYAVIRHRLVDIKIVLRSGTAWVSLGVVGALSFWLILIFLKSVFDFQLDLTASLLATVLAMLVAIFIYRLKGQLFELMNRAFQGSSYDYHQKLNDFTSKIHNVFSLKEQGAELLGLLIKAINVKQACLLFPEAGSGDFLAQFIEPKDRDNRLARFRLRTGNPVIRYLEREQKPLTKENLAILPSFLGLWPREKEELESKEISMFVPLISRERLIAILVLGNKYSGRFSLEEMGVIEHVTSRVAVSMEKEYLREQLREREEELSIINNSSFILSSSLDIQEIFGSFIEELKKVIDVEWASIVLLDDNDLCCVALSSPEGSAYQVGERIPLEGSGSGWVISQKKLFVESDLSQGRYFKTGEHFYQRDLRTVVYLPLIAKGRAIGSLVITSKRPNAYGQRHIKLLEQLTSQIAMPLENTLLYAKAEKKARIDELTGLLNRRSLDEMIDNEISRHSRYGGVFSLAILDLDSFKVYNDSYGHPAGDRLLRQVGSVINSTIRNVDRAFRYGGDEFAILLPQTTIDEGLQVTERVRKSIAEGVNSGEVPVTISIGLASWPDDGISHTDIIAAADVTLYRAKRSGGNQSCRASGTLVPLQIGGMNPDAANCVNTKILEVARALSETVDSRSYYTFNHSKRVAGYSLALGRMLNLDTEELSRLEACALLHDIGKIGISDAVINKPTELTGEEWTLVKTHPKLGADMAGRIPELVSCVNGILHHHEHYDGSGYPLGLKGDEIPLEARILAIADSYVAMTSERSYSGTLKHEDAIKELEKCAGKQYDPYLIAQFISIDRNGISGEKNTARR